MPAQFSTCVIFTATMLGGSRHQMPTAPTSTQSSKYLFPSTSHLHPNFGPRMVASTTLPTADRRGTYIHIHVHVCVYPQNHTAFCSLNLHVQWSLSYPAPMGPDCGQISETAGYVNHQKLLNIHIPCTSKVVQTLANDRRK